MVNLFGVEYQRRDLIRKIGNIDQIGGVKYYELKNGKEKGVEAIDFRTGSGLNFSVLPGRGMDISYAEFSGIPLCWRSPTGNVAPWFYESEKTGWLRSFYGGLLVTCGLTYAGVPSIDEDESVSLHGRVSNTPAENIAYGERWEKDECILWAQGIVKESIVFGENISLERNISTKLGEHKISIHDKVENLGFTKIPHMIIYHINIGFPIIDKDSELIAPVEEVKPRDKEAEETKDEYNIFTDPIRGYSQKVYYLNLKPDEKGDTYAGIVNRKFLEGRGIGIYIKYNKSQLDYFIEWKMMGEGTYVVGIEPANCHVEGRAQMRKEGNLKFLDPGEVREYHLEIGVLKSKSDIESFEKTIQGIDHPTR